MPSIHYKPEIALSGCNSGVTRALGPLACGISRSGGRRRRTQKGGNRCFVPPNPTPSSYWPAPPNPAPPNEVPPTPCQFPHYRPLVLSQFGGKKTKRSKRKCCRRKTVRCKTYRCAHKSQKRK